MYKYKATLDKIRAILIKYEPSLEAMCDLATCLLTKLLPNIEIIVGKVHTPKRINHVWAYDSKEKYYIDITSEQFGFPPCLCFKELKIFEDLGYTISNVRTVHQCEELEQGPVIFHKGKEITMKQILIEITKPKWSFGGTRRKKTCKRPV
jgi:hypothetical protein